MIIKGWAVREGFDPNLYFTGMNADNKPIFEPLCCRTRAKYKVGRSLDKIMKTIIDSGYEGCPEPYYIDGVEVEDEVPVPQKTADVSLEVPAVPHESDPESPYEQIISEVLKPPEGWRVLDHFGKNLALLYNGKHFAIRNKDGSLTENMVGWIAAQAWSEIRGDTLTDRIMKLGGAS